MTDEPTAVRATFSDFKLIRTRQIVQIVLEIPLEEADTALATLGGLPRPDKEAWVALARLNGVTKPEAEPKEKRKWDDLKLSMQAGIRCEEKAFQKFMREEIKYPYAKDNDSTARAVKDFCWVESRSGLNTDPESADRWRDLDRSYQAWLKAAE